jgi:hypothetical protein
MIYVRLQHRLNAIGPLQSLVLELWNGCPARRGTRIARRQKGIRSVRLLSQQRTNLFAESPICVIVEQFLSLRVAGYRRFLFRYPSRRNNREHQGCRR